MLVLALALSAGCALPQIEVSPAPSQSPAPESPAPQPSPPINPGWTPPVVAAGDQSLALPSIAEVVAAVKPSVAAIVTEVVTFDLFNRPFTQQGAGSGWILDADGIVVTNNHVVEGANSITVTMDDGQTFIVGPESVFTDPLTDLAIIQIDAHNLPALRIGDSSRLRVGDWVVAIGNALGQGIRATEGIVSRQNVSVQVAPGQTLFDLVETSAAINPGNSGGPLVNLAGEVIGIASVKLVDVQVEGVGYAISTETALPIIEELIKSGYVTRPWLGVVLATVDQFAVTRFDLKVDAGVLITQVVPDSPAAQAGLQPGDVITSFAGEEVDSADAMVRIIQSAEIGQAVAITFWRGETELSGETQLVERPRS
jgi:serine protease Do